jgi:murein DD-endopeptidase MepM/ murein hydrolase activator NlpD
LNVEIYIVLLLLVVNLACEQSGPESNTSANKSSPSKQPTADARVDNESPCIQFDELNTLVRDGLIARETARTEIKNLLPRLKAYFYANGGVDALQDDWVFPVLGYNQRSIGGIGGNGYVPRGYDYFDGNRHGGHPAHDIFIVDKNQDELDDNTKRSVEVLAMKSGVVVATAKDWSGRSDLRGGKYVYVFEPVTNSLLYYAHNREIFVKPGDVVKAGTVLAYVGRSGKNASPSRSPTHLHVMWLVFDDGYPKPSDLYQALLTAQVLTGPKA